jgi:hypothetical protein
VLKALILETSELGVIFEREARQGAAFVESFPTERDNLHGNIDTRNAGLVECFLCDSLDSRLTGECAILENLTVGEAALPDFHDAIGNNDGSNFASRKSLRTD